MVRGGKNVGWAKPPGAQAAGGVPTIFVPCTEMVGTAQARLCPPYELQLAPQRLDDRVQPVSQRGRAGLENQWRFDLDDAVIANRRNLAPTGPLANPLRHHLLAAP